ncbi:MAG: CRISPR-associated protein Cas4 [Rhodocyclaceae bacterium]|jgi:CRISPR-associated exonuclease Cas4|nr:CRISPR-associated protein Cas4 [Rhodocyclaceae bacterium]
MSLLRDSSDVEPIPISALEHWSYCPRQCCLIHAEQAFAENVHTLRGQAVHSRTDEPGVETRPGLRVARAIPLWCDRLGLVGKSDVVEFLADGTPYPVEYKHGKKRQKQHDDIQLAAQALCLEEMEGRPVPYGAIYHASSRRRREVAISAELRQAVETAIAEIRAALAAPRLPPPVNDERCSECSLIDLCQPAAVAASGQQRQLAAHLFDADDGS